MYSFVYQIDYDLKQEQKQKQLYLGDLLLLWKYCGSLTQQIVYEQKEEMIERQSQKI